MYKDMRVSLLKDKEDNAWKINFGIDFFNFNFI